MKIITTIRLEHFDRVLQAIQRKIRRPARRSSIDAFEWAIMISKITMTKRTNERDVDGLHLYQPDEGKSIDGGVEKGGGLAPTTLAESKLVDSGAGKNAFPENSKTNSSHGSILKSSQRSESDASRNVHFNDPTTPEYKKTKQLRSGRKLGDLPSLSFGFDNSFGQLSLAAQSGNSLLAQQNAPASLADASVSRTTNEYSNASWRRTSPSEIRQIIPKLDVDGVGKWANLAKQLHLPLALVKVGVKATFACSDFES
jgi:hypothetical protein